jgi:hypothetical protein
MSVQAIKAIDGIRFSVWSPTEIRFDSQYGLQLKSENIL